MPALRAGIELGPGRAIGSRAAACRPSATSSGVGGVLAAHGARAFTAAASADPRLSFYFLLGGFAAGFLALGLGQVLAVFLLAFVFRGACLMKSDGNRLAPALHSTAFATSSSLQFAILQFVHTTTCVLPRPCRRFAQAHHPYDAESR